MHVFQGKRLEDQEVEGAPDDVGRGLVSHGLLVSGFDRNVAMLLSEVNKRGPTDVQRPMSARFGEASALELFELFVDGLVAESVGDGGDFLGFFPLQLEERELPFESATLVFFVHRHLDGEARFQWKLRDSVNWRSSLFAPRICLPRT